MLVDGQSGQRGSTQILDKFQANGNCDVSAAVSLEALQGNGASGGGNASLNNATPVYGVVIINGDNVNLRSGPSLQSSVIFAN